MGRMKETVNQNTLSLKNFPALNNNVLVNNLTAGESLNFQDLNKVTVPTGGLKVWAVDTAEGQATVEKMIGIVLVQTLSRFLYAKPFEETGGLEPPLCFSTDSLTAHFNNVAEIPAHLSKIGMPTGECPTCPFAQYGTRFKSNGNPSRGQACQQKRLLLMLTEGSQMPQVISIPPSGLKAAKKYLIDLQALGLEYWQVLTEIRLIDAKNLDGITYARPQFRMVESLPQSLLKPVQSYRTELEQQLPVNQIAANYPALSQTA